LDTFGFWGNSKVLDNTDIILYNQREVISAEVAELATERYDPPMECRGAGSEEVPEGDRRTSDRFWENIVTHKVPKWRNWQTHRT
jgi:hypothetical protein